MKKKPIRPAKKPEEKMRLSPPKKNTFWISVIVAAVGFVVYLLTYFQVIPVVWLDLVAFLVVAAAFAFLAFSLTIKGL